MKTLLSAVLFLGLLLFGFTTRALAQASFPLVCRGGGSMGFRYSAADKTITVIFKAGTKPADQGLLAGQCSWKDRGFRPGEPSFIYHRGITEFNVFWNDNPVTVVPNPIKLTGIWALRDPGQFVTFNVYNEGSCMRVK